MAAAPRDLIVLAIGGNSLIKDEGHRTVPDQWALARETCHHIAQIDGNRRAQRNDPDGQIIHPRFQTVKLAVIGDHAIRLFPVILDQCIHGIANGCFGKPAHFQDQAAERFNFLVKGLDGVLKHQALPADGHVMPSRG